MRQCIKCNAHNTVFHRVLKDRKLVNIDFCARCYHAMDKSVLRHCKRSQAVGAESSLTTRQWAEILRSSQGHCHYCFRDVGIDALTLEHIRPISQGGGTTIKNVIAVCPSC